MESVRFSMFFEDFLVAVRWLAPVTADQALHIERRALAYVPGDQSVRGQTAFQQVRRHGHFPRLHLFAD